MENEIETTTWSKIKNHFNRHKVSYALGALVLFMMHNNVKNMRQWEEFLTSKGIDPMEYFLTAEDFAAYQNGTY